jgi:YesN/AraC family two-component response regulator
MPAILIVEDEAIVADDIRETLLSLKYSIAGTTRSGELAPETVRDTRPDLS